MSKSTLPELAKLIRYYTLTSTTAAGSGHPTSSLSATDLMITLMFGGFFKADLDNPENIYNDRLIFSKGHAAPLFYSLYAAAGKVSETELLTLRKFNSPLEGHPTMQFPYTEAATGSLGQGLSIGVGMALNAQYEKLPYKTFVLLGDSEMAEGSNWEAIQLAVHYKLDNLVGIIDVNHLGQRGETMYGYKVQEYQKRAAAFGWNTIVVDGHNYKAVAQAFKKAIRQKGKPVMIIAKTIKGKGVKFLENKEGWHGKVLSAEECEKVIKRLGKIDTSIRGEVAKPVKVRMLHRRSGIPPHGGDNEQVPHVISEKLNYKLGDVVATRKAYGNALARLGKSVPEIVALDGETSNSTEAAIFKKTFPKRFFEMYIAEQNMVGAALGLSRRGKIPFVSTFTAFFTRAHDQIRMSQYSNGNIKFVGSHGGVSIGEDGASQMGLEDIALFRSMLNSVVLYPCDAVSTERLIEKMIEHTGIAYMRTTRKDTPVLYLDDEEFKIGGSKVLHQSKYDEATIIGAGVTVFEALQAYNELKRENIFVRVIDLYSIKPIDMATLERAAYETKNIIVVEDHYAEGGISEAVNSAFSELRTPSCTLHTLAVRKMPHSGTPEELMRYEEIDAAAIVKKVKSVINT